MAFCGEFPCIGICVPLELMSCPDVTLLAWAKWSIWGCVWTMALTIRFPAFRDERGNDHDAFLSLHNSYVRKTVPVNLVNSFRDFKQRSFGIGTGNAPRIRFVFGALFRILHAVKVILVCSVHSASPYGHCQKRGGQTVYFYDHIGALLMECAKNKREACFPEFTM